MKPGILLLVLTMGTALFLCAACSEKSNPAEAEDGLCPGESGVGARVRGRVSPVDVCVPDDNVINSVEQGVLTSFTIQNRYDVTARMTGPDGTEFLIQMLFPHKPDLPKALNLTANLSQATNDPDGAWFYYREIPASGDAVESVSVTGGTFTLSFSDTEIATGTFAGITLELQTMGTIDPAGSRSIPEGFFSVSTDP